jgi:DNA repair protein REV1
MGSRLEKNSESVRKRIEKHTFDGEDGEEYGGSAFGVCLAGNGRIHITT